MEFEGFNWSVFFMSIGQLFLVYIIFNLGNKYRYLMDELICVRIDLNSAANEISRLHRSFYDYKMDKIKDSISIVKGGDLK